ERDEIDVPLAALVLQRRASGLFQILLEVFTRRDRLLRDDDGSGSGCPGSAAHGDECERKQERPHAHIIPVARAGRCLRWPFAVIAPRQLCCSKISSSPGWTRPDPASICAATGGSRTASRRTRSSIATWSPRPPHPSSVSTPMISPAGTARSSRSSHR